jgi:hypothetical protein
MSGDSCRKLHQLPPLGTGAPTGSQELRWGIVILRRFVIGAAIAGDQTN